MLDQCEVNFESEHAGERGTSGCALICNSASSLSPSKSVQAVVLTTLTCCRPNHSRCYRKVCHPERVPLLLVDSDTECFPTIHSPRRFGDFMHILLCRIVASNVSWRHVCSAGLARLRYVVPCQCVRGIRFVGVEMVCLVMMIRAYAFVHVA